MSQKSWYVVHTYAGYENKVKANLLKRAASMGMENEIFRILVPEEQEVEYKDGQKKLSMRKVFPGYVLVEMIMTDDSWYVVRNTPGVTGFVGPGSKPVPLHPSEVKAILHRMGIAEETIKFEYEVGEYVRINSGPFKDMQGPIREINPERGKIKVVVSVFGRETPVELEMTQVEKL